MEKKLFIFLMIFFIAGFLKKPVDNLFRTLRYKLEIIKIKRERQRILLKLEKRDERRERLQNGYIKLMPYYGKGPLVPADTTIYEL